MEITVVLSMCLKGEVSHVRSSLHEMLLQCRNCIAPPQILTFIRPYPPPEVLQSLLQIYIERISDQPLPLFDTSSLRSTELSGALLNSFLALTVRFSRASFFDDAQSKAVEYYKSAARNELFRYASEPTGSIAALQALCLLCLAEIYDGRMVSAWMASGVAARVIICSNLAILEAGRPTARKSDLSRCCWSLLVLDRIHGSSLRTIPAISDEGILPEMPTSIAHVFDRVRVAEPTRYNEEKDEGIRSYSLQLLITWGRLMQYLKSIKQGNREYGWEANSGYAQIKARMSEFETIFPEAHRFTNTKFHEKTSAELCNDRAYWAPWIFTQCIYHTIHCTLNHPFLHVARIHGEQKLRSPSFLQHAIDQTILHSNWVIQLLALCEERDFKIYDPFVAHMAAMIATAQFFLRFSKDEALGLRATRDFERLQDFVTKSASDHPHLLYTKAKLSKLAQLAAPYNDATRAVQPPKVETALLWDLLDYAVSSSPTMSSGGGPVDDVELSVNTQFLLPVDQTTAPSTVRTIPISNNSSEPFPPNFWDDPALAFDMADFSNLPDMSAFAMPKDAWVNGLL
ncbi:hypothetical protein PV08_04002 [Exophiala spinifera]|uniref:Xylanolytic transcriptional activator regulatory domain-containing protein n=1 Tax=Exophiala spinifera TaxID=91928 RepID=A0A0D1ZVS1_9EURO|nr:uncharacterized protein PV08_04002 [Exophiala spinifera]KIW16812.1 hypothetical protein PV08_04002 [Exophiala spinifera]